MATGVIAYSGCAALNAVAIVSRAVRDGPESTCQTRTGVWAETGAAATRAARRNRRRKAEFPGCLPEVAEGMKAVEAPFGTT